VYDAIVIGARCAGAATAMLLARKGHDVLLVDRARFPSEIPHGHFIHRHGPRRLAEWGLLDRILATGCPAVTAMTTDMCDFALVGTELEVDGIPMGLGPRRSPLDRVLVEAAAEAGAELREGFAVQDFTTDELRITGVRARTAGGSSVKELATVVVGADGRNSSLARRVAPPLTESAPTLACWYFSYWSGVSPNGLELYLREDRVIFAFPTNDDLFAIFVAAPIAELARVRTDIEAHILATVRQVPELAERVALGRREERLLGATQLPNFVRKPYGPGWALVGDAGCHKDPYLALGICDALRDAELLADALHEGLSGRLPIADALAGYERERDRATLPDYHRNLAMARLKPPPADVLALRAAVRSSATETRQFYLANQGMIDPEPFFSPENIRRLLAGSAAGAPTAE
jgi:flavin-dependent dehydrogenase